MNVKMDFLSIAITGLTFIITTVADSKSFWNAAAVVFLFFCIYLLIVLDEWQDSLPDWL